MWLDVNRVSGLIGLSYAHNNGYYGQGITVAIVDSGIAYHEDFGGRATSRFVAAVDMVNGMNIFYDDLGHGTHVAGIIGGNGSIYRGIAPCCRYVSVKVLDRRGAGKLDNVISGLRWIEDNAGRYDIRIVNISVGSPKDKSYDENSRLVGCVDRLWDMGLVVLVAAGNNGPARGSVGAPGISRKVITVGSLENEVNNNGNSVSDYSGRGPTLSCIKKPDIVAPGSNIISCNNRGKRYTGKSGTSMSTPIVSGAVALLLSKNPQMTNREVKIRLKNRAVDMGLPHERQGWGMISIKRLLEEQYYSKN